MLNELLFSDDQGLINEDEWQLQKHVTSLNKACIEHKMQIIINKTIVMSVSRKQRSVSTDINSA